MAQSFVHQCIVPESPNAGTLVFQTSFLNPFGTYPAPLAAG
jgi:hypothetical protein